MFLKSYTYRKVELDLAAFAVEESRKVSIFKYNKESVVYQKCKGGDYLEAYRQLVRIHDF